MVSREIRDRIGRTKYFLTHTATETLCPVISTQRRSRFPRRVLTATLDSTALLVRATGSGMRPSRENSEFEKVKVSRFEQKRSTSRIVSGRVILQQRWGMPTHSAKFFAAPPTRRQTTQEGAVPPAPDRLPAVPESCSSG